MTIIYLSALALFLVALFVVISIYLMVSLKLLDGFMNMDPEVDEADVAAPEGWWSAFYLDPDENRGNRKWPHKITQNQERAAPVRIRGQPVNDRGVCPSRCARPRGPKPRE